MSQLVPCESSWGNSDMPEGWRNFELGEVVARSTEKGIDGLPVFSVSMGGMVRRSDLGRRVVSSLRSSEHLLAREGDLAYNMMRMWQGVAGVAPEDCLVSPAYVVCRLRPAFLPGFARHLVQWPNLIQKFKNASRGLTADRLRLYYDDFAAILAALPPLPEQRKIAEILDTLDDAIRKTEEIIAKLEQVKQGLLHDLLTRGIDDNGELRDPVRHPEQFKDSPLGRIPKSWEVRVLEDLTIAPICYGIVQAGPYHPGGPHVLMIRNLNGDYQTGLHRTSPQIDDRYSRSRVKPGDVLLSIKGTIGRLGIVPSSYRGNISRDLARLRFSMDAVPNFATQYFASLAGARRLELAVVGTTRAEISIHVLKRLTMPVPSVCEQAEIANRNDGLEQRLRAEARHLRKLHSLKRGLMEDLLTGRVRVTPLLDEPTK